MSNTAILSFNTSTNKWEATYNNIVLVASPDKYYVNWQITRKKSTKALKYDVTMVKELLTSLPSSTKPFIKNQPNHNDVCPAERFNINDRFGFLIDFVTMVSDGTTCSLVVTGEGGIGKTHTVAQTLQTNGMINADTLIGDISEGDSLSTNMLNVSQDKLFSIVKGYSTPKALYRTLFENRNRLTIFDDCDSVLKDPVAINLLKGALDSQERRIISWNAETRDTDDLPKSFEFKGRIIFISNMTMSKIDQAVRTRAICVDLSMSTSQKIERMGAIVESDFFLPEFDYQFKKAALDLLEGMQHDAKELNFRTLITVTKVASRGDENWKRRAEYLLTAV